MPYEQTDGWQALFKRAGYKLIRYVWKANFYDWAYVPGEVPEMDGGLDRAAEFESRFLVS